MIKLGLRDTKILDLLCEGKTLKQAAAAVDISQSQLHRNMLILCTKFGYKTKYQLVAAYVKYNIEMEIVFAEYVRK